MQTGTAPPLMPFISQCVVAVQRTFAHVELSLKSKLVCAKRETPSVRERLLIVTV